MLHGQVVLKGGSQIYYQSLIGVKAHSEMKAFIGLLQSHHFHCSEFHDIHCNQTSSYISVSAVIMNPLYN